MVALRGSFTMPVTSRRQLAAMYAAKAGQSTLGIPQKAGAEFIAATPRAIRSNLMTRGSPEVRASRRLNVRQRFARKP